MEWIRATNDDIEVLEAVLDRLQERGIAVTRLKVGSIELDISSISGSATERSGVMEAFPPADPGLRVVPAAAGPKYGASSLWPLGSPPTFDPPKAKVQ